ncbi:MAG: SIMPL domain-containing protein [Candidatus Binatia bacterium]
MSRLSPLSKRAWTLLLASALVLPAAAAAEETPPPRTIRVQGNFTVKAVPDRASIAVSVVTRAPTAGEASAANARVSKEVLTRLRAAVKAPGEVRTGGYDLAPEYDYSADRGGGEGPRLVGYTSTNRFSIVSADLDGVGALLDASVAAGANRIDSISFFLEDDEAARREALIQAGRAARTEAGTIAESLGVEVGEVLDAATVSSPSPPIVYGREKMAMAMRAEDASTEVVPGTLEISASVTVTFAIR